MSVNSNPAASQQNIKKLHTPENFSFIAGVVETRE
jgi:hypothetical protein